MEFTVTYNLSTADREAYLQFYSGVSQKTIEQHPDWPLVEKAAVHYSYFIARDDDGIVGAAVIAENKSSIFHSARIQFGPLFRDIDTLTESLKFLFEHFRKQRFMALTVQLAMPTGNNSDLVEYRLNRLYKITTQFDRNNWSSLQLDLHQSEEDIFRNFSKGHKSDLKKAAKQQLYISEVGGESEWFALMNIFTKMNQRRGLEQETTALLQLLQEARSFFQVQKAGMVLIVKDAEENVLGGVLLAFQGNTVRYFKGAADPDQRKFPVLHLAIWEGIKTARQQGFGIFDFWGYNHFVTEEDQVYFINRFKKGFGGAYSFYPKRMYVIYQPLKYRLFNSLKRLTSKLFNR